MKNHINIFIVEDNYIYANLLKRELSNFLPCEISIYTKGKDCLDNLYKIPDIIILDHNLGDMNGMEVFKEIREVNQEAPVIFLSGQKKMSVAVEALKHGAFDYLEKNEFAIRLIKEHVQKLVHYCNFLKQKHTYNRFKAGFFAAVLLYVVSILYLYLI